MKKLTKLATVVVISTAVVSAPVMASTAVNPAPAQEVQLTATDIEFAFAESNELQVLALSDKEMVTTEGAWFGAVARAGKKAFGAVRNHFNRSKSIPDAVNKSSKKSNGRQVVDHLGRAAGKTTSTVTGGMEAGRHYNSWRDNRDRGDDR